MSLIGWFHTTALGFDLSLFRLWESGLYLVLMHNTIQIVQRNHRQLLQFIKPTHSATVSQMGWKNCRSRCFHNLLKSWNITRASAIEDDCMRALLDSGSRCHWNTTEIQTPHKTNPRELLCCLHRQLRLKTTETTLYTLWGFHEEPLTSTQSFHSTKGPI